MGSRSLAHQTAHPLHFYSAWAVRYVLHLNCLRGRLRALRSYAYSLDAKFSFHRVQDALDKFANREVKHSPIDTQD
jgi:hypothetical protein